MVIRSWLSAGFAIAWCAAASADGLAGHYRMEGLDTLGATYSGTADISMSFENTCRIAYSDGWEGICMVNGKTVTAAYIVHGKTGLVIYEIQDDGSLKGIFIDDFHGGKFGHETLTPMP